MKKTVKQVSKKRKENIEFRPYRVLFLVVVVAMTCLVFFAILGVTGTA